MKKTCIIFGVMLLAMNSICAFAQRSYPDDIFYYEFENPVSYQGDAPKIGDFIAAILNEDETSEVLGALDVVWGHYLRQEPQEPCDQFMLDEKNGYARYTFDTRRCDDYDDLDEKYYHEICYWNCADGKHKLVAENFVSMLDGKFFNGQYSGISFYLYDNATRKMWQVGIMDLGADVEETLSESAVDTGEQLTRSDEVVLVYRLPQQGKDINVEIFSGTRKAEACLVWDGMRFKQQ